MSGRIALGTEPLARPLAIPAAQASPTGLIRGYASVFGGVDLAGDRIEPGAFAQSLARRGTASVRMLWQHDPGRPIGVWTALAEDGHGLRVEGLWRWTRRAGAKPSG